MVMIKLNNCFVINVCDVDTIFLGHHLAAGSSELHIFTLAYQLNNSEFVGKVGLIVRVTGNKNGL